MRFEWDPVKATANIVNHHGVSFLDGRKVFRDPAHITIQVRRPGLPEPRFLTIGVVGRVILTVVWTPRQSRLGPSIRIMSVRSAHATERDRYSARP